MHAGEKLAGATELRGIATLVSTAELFQSRLKTGAPSTECRSVPGLAHGWER